MSDLPETTQLVTFALHLAFVSAAAREDGFSLADVGKYLPLLKEIGPALSGSDRIPKEIREMTPYGALELVGVVQELTGAQIKGGHAHRVTDAALNLARDLVILLETIQNADATLPSTTREPDAIDRLDAELSRGSETRLPSGELVEVRRATLAEDPEDTPHIEPVVVAGVVLDKHTKATAVVLPPGSVPAPVAYVGPGGRPADPLPVPRLREKTPDEIARAAVLGKDVLEG